MNLKNILRGLKKMLFYILAIIIILIVIGILFITLNPTFGASSKGDSLERIQNSENFNGKTFQNLVPTTVMVNTSRNETDTKESSFSLFSMLSPPKDKHPSKPLPSVKFDKNNLKDDSFIWFGHSTILMKTNNQTIMVDPVFNRASPVFVAGKPFEIENPIAQEDLPNLDVIVITHDHYDHLDYKAIKEFGNNVKRYIVPLGVKADLLRWGIEANRIEELDWYENVTYNNIIFTLTPSRHFSGRSLSDRAKTLWGGYVIKSKTQNIYISGDGGYFDEFKKIGKSYGPFDISFVEDGENEIIYELNNSTAAKELYNQLPLTIKVEDYSDDEKIFYPPKKLRTENTSLANAKLGTLAYFEPWGDVVMYYDDFGSYSGLYELGNVVSGKDQIKDLSGEIKIEKIE